MRKRKQRHRPYAGGDRPGKPSRIAFWDNIFYWLWHYTEWGICPTIPMSKQDVEKNLISTG